MDGHRVHTGNWRAQAAYTYERHEITRSIGAYAARAADLDADCDLDIVLSSYRSRVAIPAQDWGDPLLWLENDGTQVFTRHPIAGAPAHLVSLEVVTMADRLWILLGSMSFTEPSQADAELDAFAVPGGASLDVASTARPQRRRWPPSGKGKRTNTNSSRSAGLDIMRFRCDDALCQCRWLRGFTNA